MRKKILVSAILLFILASISCFCFAADNMVNDVRNVVGNTGNMVENSARDVGNALTGGNSDNMGTNNQGASTTSNVSGSYDASRTSTDSSSTLLGMDGTMWTWVILAITAIAIIALVWYYTSQTNNQHYHSSDE